MLAPSASASASGGLLVASGSLGLRGLGTGVVVSDAFSASLIRSDTRGLRLGLLGVSGLVMTKLLGPDVFWGTVALIWLPLSEVACASNAAVEGLVASTLRGLEDFGDEVFSPW